MCKMNGEIVDHLLHYEVARALWNAIFSRFSLWKMVPSCLMWCLWRERNDRNFEDKDMTFEELITSSFFFFIFFVYLDCYIPSSLSD
jgi:hypothetical protein